MSTEQHLDTWRKLKAAALEGLDVAGFAIVAVTKDGEVYYGANFSTDERVRRDLGRYLSITQRDLRQTNKALEGKELRQ